MKNIERVELAYAAFCLQCLELALVHDVDSKMSVRRNNVLVSLHRCG